MKANKNLTLIKLEINITFIILSIFSILKVFYDKNSILSYVLFGFTFVFLILILFTAYLHNPKNKTEIEISHKIFNLEKHFFIFSNILFIFVLFLLIFTFSPYFIFYDYHIITKDNQLLKIFNLTFSNLLLIFSFINLVLESIIINKILVRNKT